MNIHAKIQSPDGETYRSTIISDGLSTGLSHTSDNGKEGLKNNHGHNIIMNYISVNRICNIRIAAMEGTISENIEVNKYNDSHN